MSRTRFSYYPDVPSLPKLSTVAVLLHVAAHDDAENYALAICKATGYPSGTVVPLLARLSDRDGLLTKHDVATTTGRARVVYALTSAGDTEATRLRDLLAPHITLLASVPAKPVDELPKVNASTIWIFAAALLNNGKTYGYATSMRPLTHQAAYTEIQRMTELGWLEPVDDSHHMTKAGEQAAATIARQWQPLL
jgi:DNA-binding PadR family transcriptional regulator